MLYLNALLALVALQVVQGGSYGGDKFDYQPSTDVEWENQSGEGAQAYEQESYVPKPKCYAPPSQAPFNNKAITYNPNTDPANFDSNPAGRKHGITADSVIKAGLKPGKILQANGFKYSFANWGKGKKDNWIESGQKVIVKSEPGANRLGFLLASDMGSFGAEYKIVYTDCSTQNARVGASDWKWKIELAPGNTVAQRGLVSSFNKVEVRLFSAEVPIEANKEIAYVEFPNKVYPIHPYMRGYTGHVHVFALATKKIGY
ncbi:hypothetical protein K7432_009809 [Basidiobolus ranarum]|uniref:Uncharacterized protein n=1 Tax=Basidiobolus ranarum TaxID=34480 RepID=A0ABR2WPT5_9FUNG